MDMDDEAQLLAAARDALSATKRAEDWVDDHIDEILQHLNAHPGLGKVGCSMNGWDGIPHARKTKYNAKARGRGIYSGKGCPGIEHIFGGPDIDSRVLIFEDIPVELVRAGLEVMLQDAVSAVRTSSFYAGPRTCTKISVDGDEEDEEDDNVKDGNWIIYALAAREAFTSLDVTARHMWAKYHVHYSFDKLMPLRLPKTYNRKTLKDASGNEWLCCHELMWILTEWTIEIAGEEAAFELFGKLIKWHARTCVLDEMIGIVQQRIELPIRSNGRTLSLQAAAIPFLQRFFDPTIDVYDESQHIAEESIDWGSDEEGDY